MLGYDSIFRTYPVIFRTNPVIFRTNPVYHGVREVYHGVREGQGVREVYHGVRKVYHGVNHQLLVSIFKGQSNIKTVLIVTNKKPGDYSALQIFGLI